MNSTFNRHEPDFDVLHQVSENLYTFVTRFLFDGKMPLHNRSVVVHLPARAGQARGTLVIINPSELHPATHQALKQLEEQLQATVRYLISTGDWHYLFMGQHLGIFPEAKAYVTPGRIPSKNPGFPYTLIDVTADNPFPELAPELQVLNVHGLLDTTDPHKKLPRYELVFHHPESGVLTSGDVLWYRLGELPAPLLALGARSGVLEFHFWRWKAVRDAKALARSFEQMLRWNFDRYIPVHGAPGTLLEAGAKAHLEAVLAWAHAPPADFVPVIDG